jgi:hypothetical protein
MVIEFKFGQDIVIQSKLSRFKELNTKYFMQNISDNEQIELNKLEKWLKLHKDLL